MATVSNLKGAIMSNSWSKKHFWYRVETQSEKKENGCIEFTGCKDSCGYGRINNGKGKLVRLHRAVWEREHGTIPDGMVVMHLCDNRACINIAHLVLGTQAQNVADMDLKRRRKNLRGTQRAFAKLAEKDIPSIRARLAAGETCAIIASSYGVSEGLIRHIKKGRIWTHVT